MVNSDVYLLCRSDEFHLDPGEEASINLKLQKALPLPCTRLCGQVVSKKKPIAGATVKVLSPNLTPICHTETDLKGRFSFDRILPPGKYEIIAAADGYLISKSRFIFLKPFRPMYVLIKLCPDCVLQTAALYGTVRSGENKPLQGATVRISGYDKCRHRGTTITNADGEYLFSDLAPGKYIITAFRRGYTLPKENTVEMWPSGIFRADLYLYKNI